MSRADNTTLPTTSLPIRMRVHGMDCAKDAAEIERAARSAGVAEGDVKVSAATHVMTLRIAEDDLPKVRPALDATGYGFELIKSAQSSRAKWDDDNVKLEVLRLKFAIEIDDSAGGKGAA